MKKRFMAVVAAFGVFLFAGGALAQLLPPVGTAPAGSPVAQYGRLRVQGNKILPETGTTPVQLRGMSYFWSSDTEYARKFWNERVVAWLVSDWRISVIRAAVGVSNSAAFTADGVPYRDDKPTHKNLVHTVAAAAIEQGIYFIIDWHSHYAHQEEAEAIAFFEEMATIYKDYPNVIYEIYNEPKDRGMWSGTLKGYSQRVIDKIRAIDPNGLIIVPTAFYCQEVRAPADDPITGRANIVYSMHFYCDHGFLSDVTYAAGKIPLFASEFGTSQANGDGTCGSGDHGNTTTWLNELDRLNISWANWSVSNTKAVNNDNQGQYSNALKFFPRANTTDNSRLARGRWTDNDLTPSGRFIRERLRGNNPGPNRRYTINITPVGEGSVSGAGTFDVCAETNLTATPANGWRHEGWIINGLSQAAGPVPLEVCSDKNVTAVFFKNNLITNSTFTAGGSGWGVTASIGAAGRGEPANGEYRVVVTQASETTNNRNLRFQQTGKSLEQGRRYTLSFDARAVSGTRRITPVVANSSGANFLIDTAAVTLTAQMQSFEVSFNMRHPSNTAAVVAFYCGSAMGDWVIDNVMLVDVGSHDDPPISASISQGSNVVSVSNAPFRAAFTGNALNLTGAAGRQAEVSVYDMSGRVRLARSVSLTGSSFVSLDRLPAGVYTVRYKVDGRLAANERIMLSR